MQEKNNPPQKNTPPDNTSKMSRRDVLKGLITIPVVGAAAYGAFKKKQYDHYTNQSILSELKMSYEEPQTEPPVKNADKTIRLGIIGYGGRGSHLLRSVGFAAPAWIDDIKKQSEKNSRDKRYQEYIEQEDLNVVVNGVCDVFEMRAQEAAAASANTDRQGRGGKMGKPAKVYKHYQELLAADDIDAVIIAAPDHWHATMLVEAAKSGKHVYVEKPITRTIEEVYAVEKAIQESNIVLQLGHQGRQTESYIKAKEAVEKNVLGKISLVEVCTNRNSPNGAWVYKIDERGTPQTIDWQEFQKTAGEKVPFSPERFFRWRCWFAYGTGLSGDLLTHEYDAINQILGMGIPDSVVASGGIYFYQDGRNVPDVFQAAMEYKDHDFTFLYSATLASDHHRGKTIMGHDANMEIGSNLIINASKRSTRYAEMIKQGLIDPNLPIYSYIPGKNKVDAVASATEQYFAGRGLLYTYRGGKRVDTTHLHLKEWLSAIRDSSIKTSCGIKEAFEEGISAHMATISYREGVKVYWDKDKRQILKGEPAKNEKQA